MAARLAQGLSASRHAPFESACFGIASPRALYFFRVISALRASPLNFRRQPPPRPPCPRTPVLPPAHRRAPYLRPSSPYPPSPAMRVFFSDPSPPQPQQEGVDRRERLRRLALETIDLAKDPYFMRNHLGQYECRLCLTLHNNEGNYLAHTQGRRHQQNLAKRAAREALDNPVAPVPKKRGVGMKSSVKIGRPGYRVTKQFDPEARPRTPPGRCRCRRRGSCTKAPGPPPPF